jgi:hypothetical protein
VKAPVFFGLFADFLGCRVTSAFEAQESGKSEKTVNESVVAGWNLIFISKVYNVPLLTVIE